MKFINIDNIWYNETMISHLYQHSTKYFLVFVGGRTQEISEELFNQLIGNLAN